MIRRILGMVALVMAVGLIAVACAGAEGTPGLKGDKGDQGPAGRTPSESELLALIDQALTGTPATAESIARGGRLYDKWWTEAGVAKPTGDQALWALQTSNTRTGGDTYRCKECHGWDYKGVGGTYSSGSHKTGFPGVMRASATMSKAELMDVLLGALDYRHDFSAMGADNLTALVNFLSEGVVNDALYLDYNAPGKPPRTAGVANGQALYGTVCVLCHGANGKQILIDGEIGIGDIARDEPTVEILHKIRSGQPGTAMASAIANGWSVQDALDVLGYAQTLP